MSPSSEYSGLISFRIDWFDLLAVQGVQESSRCHDLSFLNVEFKVVFSLSSFALIKRLFSYSSLSAIRVVSSAIILSTNYVSGIIIDLGGQRWRP